MTIARQSLQTLIALGILAVTLSPAAFGIPLLEFNFNETGVTASSSGSASGVSANLYSYSGGLVATDLHTAAGTGIAGDLVGSAFYGTDRAFSAAGGIAANTTTTAISGLQSFTVSGWYKASGNLVGGSAFFQTPGDNSFTSKGFAVRANDANDLRIGVDATTVSTTTNTFDPVNLWTFFAVTYDGTATTNNVKVYQGFRTNAEAVSASGAGTTAATILMSTLTLNKGTPLASLGFSMGARLGSTDYGPVSSIIQSMPALFDNFRVDGVTSGNGGALSLSALEAYRALDVAVVPEPGTASLLVFGAGLALARRRRRHRA